MSVLGLRGALRRQTKFAGQPGGSSRHSSGRDDGEHDVVGAEYEDVSGSHVVSSCPGECSAVQVLELFDVGADAYAGQALSLGAVAEAVEGEGCHANAVPDGQLVRGKVGDGVALDADEAEGIPGHLVEPLMPPVGAAHEGLREQPALGAGPSASWLAEEDACCEYGSRLESRLVEVVA
jgi:hypothetical protein